MNPVDGAILRFVNQFAQKCAFFDRLVVTISNLDLCKGAVVMSFVWGLWFFARGDQRRNQQALLSGILGSLVSLFVARVLAYVAPFRVRPVLDGDLDFKPPIGLPDQSNWTIWSAFPSDHAALFFALAFGVWLVSRRAGWILTVYLIVFVAFPRIYIGIHYPSDILAGAALAIIAVVLADLPPLCRRWMRPVDWLMSKSKPLFYGILFLVSYEIATIFYDVRVLLSLFGLST